MIYGAFNELRYVFINYFVTYIPFWPIRRMLYILAGMKIGKGSRILQRTIVVSPNHISIGDRTYINENCFLDGRDGILIGDDVTIAIYSKLITGGHDIDDDDFSYKGLPITIDDHCAVFADSVVLGGAVLQKGCIVSAKSLVRKGCYKNNSVYGGVPARFIRKRESTCNYRQDKWHPILR